MDPRDEIRAQLTGPGAPFEISEETVLGERMQLPKNRLPSLRALLEQSAAHGEREYLVHGERRITYADHVRRVASAAAYLREHYGVGPGDRVAILLPNGVEWPIVFWATVSLGGIVASLNGWWTEDEIAYGVEHSDPKVLVTDRKRLARVAGRDLGVPTLVIEDEFEALFEHAPDAALPDTPIAEDDPAVILYTSGTTGRPKGAVASHRGILGFVQMATISGAEVALFDARRGGPPPAPPTTQQVTLVTAPMFHLSGLYANIVLQAQFGGKLVMRSGRFDPADVLRLLQDERVTAWAALGAMGPRVAQHPDIGRYDLSSVVNVGFGGAPASPAIQDMMRKAFPNASESLGIGYGSSETVSVPVMVRGSEYREVPESTGRIAACHEVEIRDEDGNPVAEGVEGEIHVRSPYLMLGYWQNPEATEKTILPGRWLATGDIGRFEGRYLYINSRARDMILRSAENVYPVEIEYRIEEHEDVGEAAVIGVDHAELGQEVKAVVVPAPGRTLDADALASFCAKKLAAFKVPSLWEIRDEPLPRNASGKILKNVLRGEAEVTQVEE